MDSKLKDLRGSSRIISSCERGSAFGSTDRCSSAHSSSYTDRSTNFTFPTPLKQRSSNTFTSTVFTSNHHQIDQRTQPLSSRNYIEANKENCSPNSHMNNSVIYQKNSAFEYENRIKRCKVDEKPDKLHQNSMLNETFSSGIRPIRKLPSQVRTYDYSGRAITPQPAIRELSNNFTMTLTGLNTSDSEYKIRELCQGYHIVSISTSINNITGSNIGTASVTVKTSESKLNSLKTNFLQQGYSISTKKPQLGKKNNYAELATVNFLDSFVNGDGSKVKKHHLETSQDLFGNSIGVGRSHYGKKTVDKQSLALHTWNLVKNAKKAEKFKETFESLPSYMRSTQSSIKKCKKSN